MTDYNPLLPTIALIAMLTMAAAVGAAVFGFRAWWVGTRDMDALADPAFKPEKMSERRYRAVVRNTRKKRRLRRTILWSIAGAFIGVAAFFALVIYKRR